jgi:hypothetical protein
MKDTEMGLTKQQQIKAQMAGYLALAEFELRMAEFDDFLCGLDEKNGLTPSHEYNTKLKK